jgi:hypothetical protein
MWDVPFQLGGNRCGTQVGHFLGIAYVEFFEERSLQYTDGGSSNNKRTEKIPLAGFIDPGDVARQYRTLCAFEILAGARIDFD